MIEHIKKLFSFSFGTWINAFISLLFTPIITYFIVPSEFGKASMFTLVYSIAYLVSLLGLDESYMRYYNKTDIDRNKLFWECLIPSLGVSLMISFIFLLFNERISLILFGNVYNSFGILFSTSLLTGILQRYNQLSIRMQKKGIFYSLIEITKKVIEVFITIIFLMFVSKNFYALIWGQIFGTISALIFGFLIDKENRKFYWLDFKNVKEYLKYGLPIVPAALLYWLFSSIDRITLRQFSNFSEIGFYSASFKIVSVFSLFNAGFLNYWKPLAFERNEKSSNIVFYRKVSSMISFIMFTTGILVLLFKDLMILIMAKSYRNVSHIMPFLVLMPIMSLISETTVMGIYFRKKTYWLILVTLIASILNYFGNLALVPTLGAKGAAISTGISYVAFMFLRTFISEKLYPVGFEINKMLLGTITIIFVAFFGTFGDLKSLIFSSLIGFSIILYVFKNEVRFLISNLKNLVHK